MRGRDIKRYGYNWAGLWLINTHNGIRGKLDRIHIEEYPALKSYLTVYSSKLAKRSDKGDTPYNLRNCAYLEDFSKPKIVWGEISDRSKFAFDFKGDYICEATSFLMVGNDIPYLFCALNSKIVEWLFSKVGTTTGMGTIRWKKYTVEQLLIPKIIPKAQAAFYELVKQLEQGIISIFEMEELVDKKLYEVLGLTTAEISCIER